VTQQGGDGSAYMLIRSYVQNGNPVDGRGQHTISGDGISTVTFSLTAKNVRTYGTCRVLAINE
jgi:hypothetical protein